MSTINTNGTILRATACLLLLFSASFLFAQEAVLDSSALLSEPIYTSLKSAMVHPERVYRLDLSKNKLAAIPPEVFTLRNLQMLNLSKNRIKEIPPGIAELKHLQRLDLSRNVLVQIPVQIGELENLLFLDLSRNNLISLPKEIGRLKRLEYFNLWDNDLSDLPDEIAGMDRLRELELRGILFSSEDQDRFKSLLPHAKIYMSPDCNCKF